MHYVELNFQASDGRELGLAPRGMAPVCSMTGEVRSHETRHALETVRERFEATHPDARCRFVHFWYVCPVTVVDVRRAFKRLDDGSWLPW